jgi:hypothetical protein
MMQAVFRKISKRMTVCYSELFPDSTDEYFHLAYRGKLFLVADSYCMNPQCTCQEAALHFVQTYPMQGKKSESFMVKYKLNGRGYKIYEQGTFNRLDIQNILRQFTADQRITVQLNERYRIMKKKVQEILG